MKNLKSERNLNQSPKKNIGFYISLGLCVAAVAAAAWTTYGSIQDYHPITEESPAEITEQSSQNIHVGTDVSGEKYENTESSVTESSVESSEESSKEESEKPVFKDNAEESENETSGPKVTAPIENGEVLKGFSPKNPVQSKTLGDWRTHSGVDIAAGEGTPVRAIMAGEVLKVYQDALLGNIIEIDHHNNYIAYYCGLTETTIAKEGSTVKAGDTIGYVGKIPSESKDDSHLHLEVKLNDEYIDPTIIYS